MQTPNILRAASLLMLVLCCPRPWCEAQKKIAPADYDYYALAITSIADITAEASKLSDIPQRARIMIQAARILQPARKEEAVRLLEVVLRELKEWGSADTASWRQRNMAATLRNEALAVYALVDSEKALVRRKDFQSSEESAVSNNSTALNFKSGSWRTQFSDQQTAAEQPARLALSLVDTDPERALRLVVQSLQGGTVSNVLFQIVEKLSQNGNRALLDRLENNVGQVLATTISLNPYSLNAAAILALDNDMPQAAKNAFAGFFMRSLQAWATVVKEPGIDTYYIIAGFNSFSGTIRHLVLQNAPDQLLEFDWLLDQTAAFVPEKKRDLIVQVQPETVSDPKERLVDIRKDQDTRRRDLRQKSRLRHLELAPHHRSEC